MVRPGREPGLVHQLIALLAADSSDIDMREDCEEEEIATLAEVAAICAADYTDSLDIELDAVLVSTRYLDSDAESVLSEPSLVIEEWDEDFCFSSDSDSDGWTVDEMWDGFDD